MCEPTNFEVFERDVRRSVEVWCSFPQTGVAQDATNSNIPDSLHKDHGIWKSETAKDGYRKDSIDKVLPVSKEIGICN